MNHTIADTRAHLTEHVSHFRQAGVEADPIVFGTHRKPEAVLMSYATYEVLLNALEDAYLLEVARHRDEVDTGERFTLAEVAAKFNVDLSAL